MAAANPDITAIVLAGGRAERMGGSDKGLLTAGGLPLIGHVIRNIVSSVAAVVISANRNLDAYRGFGFPVVCDEMPDFAGPLAGIVAGARAAATPLLLVVPCDLPLLPPDLVPRLLGALGDGSMAVVRTPTGIEHAVMLFRRRIAGDLPDYLAGGGRSLHGWQARHAPAYADFGDAGNFVNVNSPDELRMAELRLSAGSCDRPIPSDRSP